METLSLIAQLVLGAYFINAGAQHFLHLNSFTGYAASKGLPMARVGVLVTGCMLVLGGFGVFFGIGVMCALWLLVIFLVTAALTMHAFWKEQDPMARSRELTNCTKNIALAAALVILMGQASTWPWSL